MQIKMIIPNWIKDFKIKNILWCFSRFLWIFLFLFIINAILFLDIIFAIKLSFCFSSAFILLIVITYLDFTKIVDMYLNGFGAWWKEVKIQFRYPKYDC